MDSAITTWGTGEWVTAKAPGKLNLQLAVGAPGADGLHDLVTVFQAVSVYEEVTVRVAERTSVVVRGEGAASVPSGLANLAYQAARALANSLRRRGPRRPRGVRIEIDKHVPVAAGMAGGSADAAATLVACNELWAAGLSGPELREIGARLGSDVPFSLFGGTAVGRGRGDQLTPALVAGTYHWALAFAARGLSTEAVYTAYDTRGSAAARPALSAELMAALRSGDPTQVGPLLTNDLEAAAISLRPQLRRTLATGRELGALGALVSGSGPTCAFLAKDAAHARELAVGLTGAGVCRSVTRARGPVAGAAVTAQDHG